jgi:hypothetical protein
MLVISDGYETLTDGTKYAIEVGNLALGAPEVNQFWYDGSRRFNSSLVPSYLYLTDQVPSNSFGMHIGSTALEIPPSLYIGGHDQSRVLGEVTMQDYNMHYFPIDLLDIGIGVAEGASPFLSNQIRTSGKWELQCWSRDASYRRPGRTLPVSSQEFV